MYCIIIIPHLFWLHSFLSLITIILLLSVSTNYASLRFLRWMFAKIRKCERLATLRSMFWLLRAGRINRRKSPVRTRWTQPGRSYARSSTGHRSEPRNSPRGCLQRFDVEWSGRHYYIVAAIAPRGWVSIWETRYGWISRSQQFTVLGASTPAGDGGKEISFR